MKTRRSRFAFGQMLIVRVLGALMLAAVVGSAGATDGAACGAFCDDRGDYLLDQSCAYCNDTVEVADTTCSACQVATDADFDGISDSDELNVHGTDPYLVDTDGDGLDDAAELFASGSNPLSVDSEGDGMSDYCDREPWVYNVDNDSGAEGSLFGGGMGCSSIS